MLDRVNRCPHDFPGAELTGKPAAAIMLARLSLFASAALPFLSLRQAPEAPEGGGRPGLAAKRQNSS